MSSSNKCFIIGVAGGTCAGKKALCAQIKQQLQTYFPSENAIFVLHAENFYKPLNESELTACTNSEYNFDTPNSYDFDLLRGCLAAFRNDSLEEISLPYYNLEEHTRILHDKIIAKPRVLLVEGIFVLYENCIRDLIDMKLFVDVSSDVRLSARVLKENPTEDGSNLEKILQHYLRFVKPGYDEFILPTKKYADVIIPRGTENTVGMDLISQHILGILQGKHDGQPSLPIDKSALLFVD